MTLHLIFMNTQKRNCPPEPSLGCMEAEMQRIIVFFFFNFKALFAHTCSEQTRRCLPHLEVLIYEHLPQGRC